MQKCGLWCIISKNAFEREANPISELRLDKFVCNRTGVSRTEIKAYLKSGLITVNGRAEKDGSRKICPEECEVAFKGEVLSSTRFRYIIMNKPQGVVCATQDNVSKTVMELVPNELMCANLAPAGRLDKDTEGLLLITNDGEFAHKVISPKSQVPKFYVARLESPYQESYKQIFADGIEYRGEKFKSANIAKLDKKGEFVLVEIREGKFHQVKKMFMAVSNKVLYLRREQIGKLFLPQDLVLGASLDILHKEACEMLKDESFEAVRSRIFVNFSSI